MACLYSLRGEYCEPKCACHGIVATGLGVRYYEPRPLDLGDPTCRRRSSFEAEYRVAAMVDEWRWAFIEQWALFRGYRWVFGFLLSPTSPIFRSGRVARP